MINKYRRILFYRLLLKLNRYLSQIHSEASYRRLLFFYLNKLYYNIKKRPLPKLPSRNLKYRVKNLISSSAATIIIPKILFKHSNEILHPIHPKYNIEYTYSCCANYSENGSTNHNSSTYKIQKTNNLFTISSFSRYFCHFVWMK